jgi:hypothetical protein
MAVKLMAVPPIMEPNTEIVCPVQSFKKSECRQRLLSFGFVIVSSIFYDSFPVSYLQGRKGSNSSAVWKSLSNV